MTSLKYG